MKTKFNKITLLLIVSILLSIQIKAQEIIPCTKVSCKCAQTSEGNYFINNNTTYHELFQIRSQHPACLDYSFPVIDFSQYSLLGIVTSTGGCSSPKIEYSITKNSDNNYIYELNIEQQGCCKPKLGVKVWCLIPKIADNSIIDFNIINTIGTTKK